MAEGCLKHHSPIKVPPRSIAVVHSLNRDDGEVQGCASVLAALRESLRSPVERSFIDLRPVMQRLRSRYVANAQDRICGDSRGVAISLLKPMLRWSASSIAGRFVRSLRVAARDPRIL